MMAACDPRHGYIYFSKIKLAVSSGIKKFVNR